ncbi:MAG: hypothetical protein ACLFUZ_05410 [Candidatus Micrarchaeia archaeon]
MNPETEPALREILGNRLDELNETARDILLTSSVETVRKAYSKLIELGLTPEKIATLAHLLGMNPETIQRNADSLKELGLTPEKIASQAQLLGRDPETIQRNYEFLRQFLPREAILKNANFLGNSQKTIEGSVQWMSSMGVDYLGAIRCMATTPNCKRKKVLALAKARHGYNGSLSDADKRDLIDKSRKFIRKKPGILLMGEKAIQKKYAK